MCKLSKLIFIIFCCHNLYLVNPSSFYVGQASNSAHATDRVADHHPFSYRSFSTALFDASTCLSTYPSFDDVINLSIDAFDAASPRHAYVSYASFPYSCLGFCFSSFSPSSHHHLSFFPLRLHWRVYPALHHPAHLFPRPQGALQQRPQIQHP